MNTALKNNINFFDTAHDYGNSENILEILKLKIKKNLYLLQVEKFEF